MKLLLVFVVALAIGWFCGWVVAHAAIAVDCERLGGFYVGKKVFSCLRIDKEEETPAAKR